MRIHTSEAIEGSVAFHITPADAIRASGLYYFRRGDSTQNGSVVYNGEEFKPGSLHADADFSRLSLAYERIFLQSTTDRLVGSLGLTYMYLNPTLRPITRRARGTVVIASAAIAATTAPLSR